MRITHDTIFDEDLPPSETCKRVFIEKQRTAAALSHASENVVEKLINEPGYIISASERILVLAAPVAAEDVHEYALHRATK